MATEAKRPSNRWPRQRPRPLTKFAHRLCAAPRACEAAFVARSENDMHVIGHQAIRPDFHLGLAHLLGEHVAIDVLVAVPRLNRGIGLRRLPRAVT